MVFIGIDPKSGRPPYTYVVLDADRKVFALGEGRMADVLAFAAGQGQALVAINAPSKPNIGLVERDEVRQHLFVDPEGGRWSNLRLAEYELLQKSLEITRTPGNIKDCPEWMQRCFGLYKRLEEIGYAAYPNQDAARLWVEVPSDAAFGHLLGHPLFDARTLEGRLQRQIILHDQGIPMDDPMDFFEEVTRHRLIRGKLPLDMVMSPHALNAYIAAYTAWLLVHQPENTTSVGDGSEGLIFLPAKHYD